jgi:nucleotide-binding universal stress UspA family protein
MTENTENNENEGRVVVGVDASDNAARAAAWAAHEAAARSLSLLIVHALDLPIGAAAVIEPVTYAAVNRKHAADLLERIAAPLRAQYPQLAIDTEVSDLDAARSLVTRSDGSELVVTGTRGHGGFAGMLLGSVSLKCAAHAHSPLVVVRGEDSGEPRDEIVLGVEREQHEAPIRFAFATAAKFGATIRPVRAWQPKIGYGGYYTEGLDITRMHEMTDVESLLKAVREDFPDVPVSPAAVEGNPVPILIEAAHGARLLVVGAHRHHGPLSVGAGYVVQGLLSHSPTPVAVVPIA